MHVGFLERFLHLTHSTADHWARPGAGGVNEICDPDFAGEIRTAECLAVLIDYLKWRNQAIALDLATCQTLHFNMTQPQHRGADHDRKKNERQGRGPRLARSRRIR